MVIVDCSSVILEEAPSTRVLVNFADGTQYEFASLDDLKARIDELGQNADTARLFLIGQWLAKDPSAQNLNLIQGKRLTLDLTSVDSLKVGNSPPNVGGIQPQGNRVNG